MIDHTYLCESLDKIQEKLEKKFVDKYSKDLFVGQFLNNLSIFTGQTITEKNLTTIKKIYQIFESQVYIFNLCKFST